VDQTVRAWGRLDILINNAGSAVYNATKHAMNAYSEPLRREAAGRRGSL
jgi:NADP-dependent 3-hydroxy acid dehydrogenase YdfG